jgi:hypothetical protein
MFAIVGCSVVVTRPFLADAVVVIGDAFFYAPNVVKAQYYYGRALWVDPSNVSARGRLAFGALMEHTPAALARCRAETNGARDRDLRFLAVECASASRDFAKAFSLARDLSRDFPDDPRYATFAYVTARRTRQPDVAAYFRRALALSKRAH